MTIFGLRYRPAPYAPTTNWQRLRPLATVEFLALFRSKWGVGLFCLCLFPLVVRLVLLLIYVGVLNVGGPTQVRGMARRAPHEVQDLLPTSAEFYLDPVVAPEQGMAIFLLLTALVTARAIAKDRSTNALELYWTRGISPRGYFAAKWLGSMGLVATITVLAPLLLWLTGVLMSEDWTFLEETAAFVPGCLLGQVVFTATLTATCILFSAVAGTPNLATILWAMLVFGSSVAAHVVTEIFHRDVTSWLSIWDAAAALARAVAGVPQRASVVGAVLVLGGVLLALLAVTRRRLRLQEAVG